MKLVCYLKIDGYNFFESLVNIAKYLNLKKIFFDKLSTLF